MKLFLIAALPVFITASFAIAGECVDSKGNDISSDSSVYESEIAAKTTCYEATQLARACSRGAGGDVGTAGVAYDKCVKELADLKPAKSDVRLLERMELRCTTKYQHEVGSMYRSFEAYCRLTSIEWIVNMATPN